MKKIAIYDGTCRKCLYDVRVGQIIEYNPELPRGKRVAHWDCHRLQSSEPQPCRCNYCHRQWWGLYNNADNRCATCVRSYPRW